MARRMSNGFADRRFGRRSALRALGLGATGAAFAAACSGTDDKQTSGSRSDTGAAAPTTGQAAGAQTPQPQRGGTLTLSLESQMGNLHPTEAGGSSLTRNVVYDRLGNYDYHNGKLELQAAASMETPEPTRVIFKLKPTAKFQQLPPTNGRPLTSEDVIASWNGFRDNPRSTGSKTVYTQEIASLETPDPSTLVVTFKRPNVWLLGPHGLFGPFPSTIVPKELVAGDQLQKVTVGSGGYQLESFDPASQITVVRRPDGWYDDRPYIDKLIYRVITDATARAAAFKGKQIDALTARDKLQADEFKTYGKGMEVDKDLDFPRQVYLRADQPPFNDERARQAVYTALDVKDLITRVDLGDGEWSGPVPPYLSAFALPDAELKATFPNDPRKAREQLTAAGFDFNREWELKFPAREKSQTLAEVLQRQLAAAGIKTRLIPEDPTTVWSAQTMANRNFQITSADVRFAGQDPDVWMRNYTTTGVANGNQCNWSDAEVDALVQRQQTETDPAKQKATLLEIQRLLNKKAAPIINLYSPYAYTGRWNYYHPVLNRGYVGTLGLYAWMEPKR